MARLCKQVDMGQIWKFINDGALLALSELLAIPSVGQPASTTCADLKPIMEQSQIPDVAVALSYGR
jgi:hypothetical protein